MNNEKLFDRHKGNINCKIYAHQKGQTEMEIKFIDFLCDLMSKWTAKKQKCGTKHDNNPKLFE